MNLKVLSMLVDRPCQDINARSQLIGIGDDLDLVAEGFLNSLDQLQVDFRWVN